MARLFVAVWPPEDVVAELMALPRKDERGVRFVRPDQWHVTLRFFGDASIDDVLAAMDGVRFDAATARLGPGVDVLGDRVLVLPCAGVDALAAEVERRTAAIGEPPRRRFHAHLTVARLQRSARPTHAVGALVTEEFDVAEVTLVQTRLRPDGPRYETIAAWPVG